jgi:hypothetical protein
MSNSSIDNAATSAASTIAPLLGNILVAVGGAITAWSTLSTRFQRVQRFDTDTAGGEKSFRLFYVVPQYFNAVLFVALIAIACLASIGGLMAGAAPGIRISGAETWFGRTAVAFYELGWLVVILGVAVGGIAVMDLIARIVLIAGRIVSWTPIAGIEGRFGPDGRSLGWLQAKEMVRAGGSAFPLAIDSDGIDRVAVAVVKYATETGLGGSYRATPPIGSPSAKGNIALFACIIEQIENDLQMPRRDWSKFYNAFDILNQNGNLLEPTQLNILPNGTAFYQALQAGLDPILTAFSPAQPKLPNSMVARDFVATAFERLKSKYDGDVIKMAARQPINFGSAAYGLLVRARHFPKLDDDRMGPQFVKLCIRFGAVHVIAKDDFVPAFSSSIGWFLLNNDALTALQEAKSLAFRGSMNRPAIRIGAMKAISRVADELDKSIALFPALATAVSGLGPDERRWYIEQEADTALWSAANEALKAARSANWASCRWKLDNLAATRV